MASSTPQRLIENADLPRLALRAQQLAVHAEMTVALREAHRLLQTAPHDEPTRNQALTYIRRVQRYMSGT